MSITRLLVANRGEIARRVFRTAHSMGIDTVAVYVDDDATSPHVREAGAAHRLATDSYLDVDAVLAVAVAAGADAVHPGYGFLSENAAFARAVLAAGLTWVGPPPEAIEAMGDKIRAKALAAELGVPTLPMVEDPDRAGEVGYPLLVKAAAGGGGKGMRVVHDPADLDDAVAAARREALGGFGDDRVFLERYVARSRHVEIQVLADAHGNAVHLGERECSIQRRHQKVIEEAPSPAVDPDLRERMGAAALALVRGIGYVNAGTVELLLDDTDGSFSFLEVNTRLQVEHPVTEEVTGIDLVREQLRIAAGEPLGYGQADVAIAGHAVEARLYAEDVAAGYLPATGTVLAFDPPTSVRVDAGIAAGSVVGARFDPMLAKVVAHAPTRREAALQLALALERTQLAGLTTNRDLLVAVLRSDEYLAGDTTTDFLDRVALPAPEPDPDLAVAAALWLQGRNRAAAPVLAALPSGWRNTRMPPERVGFGDDVTVEYRRRRDGSFLLGDGRTALLHGWDAGGVDVEVGGRRLAVRVVDDGERLHVHDGRGGAVLSLRSRFPVPQAEVAGGSLAAPMPGKVLDVRVAVGDTVDAGQVVVVLEAMKMEHRVTAPAAGTVTEVRVAAGDQVENGAVLLVVEEPDG